MKTSTKNATGRATALLRSKKGLFRTGEILRLGIHPRVLYALRDTGTLEQVGRGPVLKRHRCRFSPGSPSGLVTRQVERRSDVIGTVHVSLPLIASSATRENLRQ